LGGTLFVLLFATHRIADEIYPIMDALDEGVST
jgi:hypothetical protein